MNEQIPAPFVGHAPRLLILDVDGVLTDNSIHLDATGAEWKSFHVPDGLGIELLRSAGVEVALLSGRASGVIEQRARELGIRRHHAGIRDKGPIVEQMLEEAETGREEAVFVGDDLLDLPAMRRVGLPVAVANAHPEVLRSAVAVTTRAGGRGAVREVCEWILRARGAWAEVLERFST